MGHQLPKTNVPITFEHRKLIRCSVFGLKTFCPSTPEPDIQYVHCTDQDQCTYVVWGPPSLSCYWSETVWAHNVCELHFLNSWTRKSIGVISCSRQMTYTIWGLVVNALSRYWSETALLYKVNVTLTFDPRTRKSIGVICCPRPMHIWSLKTTSSCVVDYQ